MYINFTWNICVYERTFLTTNKVTLSYKNEKTKRFYKNPIHTESTISRRPTWCVRHFRLSCHMWARIVMCFFFDILDEFRILNLARLRAYRSLMMGSSISANSNLTVTQNAMCVMISGTCVIDRSAQSQQPDTKNVIEKNRRQSPTHKTPVSRKQPTIYMYTETVTNRHWLNLEFT